MNNIKVTCEIHDYSDPAQPAIRVHSHWCYGGELEERAMTREKVVKKKGDYLDCHSCIYHSRLYDRHGVTTGHWCSARNGRLKKRFRGDCKWINAKATCEGKSG